MSYTQQTPNSLGHSLIRQIFQTCIMDTTDRNVSFGAFSSLPGDYIIKPHMLRRKILMKIHEKNVQHIISMQQACMLLIVFCLRRNLHEVISRGQDSTRLVPDSGKKENYKKLILLSWFSWE